MIMQIKKLNPNLYLHVTQLGSVLQACCGAEEVTTAISSLTSLYSLSMHISSENALMMN